MSFLSVLKTAAPYHFLAYSLVFGASVYQSFYAGIVAYKALPIQDFSALQHRIFPGYFGLQLGASAILLLTPPFQFTKAAYVTLGTALLTAAINTFILLPANQSVKKRRDAQVKLEGKLWKDPTASDEMKKLNKEFGRVHGPSVLVNMTTLGSLVVYGLYFISRARF